MRIMVVGAGKVGYYLSERLSAEGQEVTLIDTDKTKLRRLEKDLNILTIHGSGASSRILEQAGIDNTDLFIAVTDSDEVNLVACIISKQYDVKTRIARVRNEDFLSQGSPMIKRTLGIDFLISPDLAMTEEVLKMCVHSEAFEAAEFAGGHVVVLGYVVRPDNPCVGLSLHQLKRLRGLIVAITRESGTIIPRGDDIIEAEDKIHIVTRREDLPQVEQQFHIASRTPRKVFIIGGGTIGTMVAKRLESQGVDVHLVEKDPARCEVLTEELEDAVVLNCNGLESHDLLDEGIDQADLVISVTNSDTANILSSLLAKHHGAKKCITRINRPDFLPMLGKLGIDVALSPRIVAANMILRFVRGGGKIVSVASLIGTDAEVLEFKVPDLQRFRGTPFKYLEFPKGAIVGAITRGERGTVIIPTGETRIEPDDNLVIFSVKDAISDVESFFEE